MTIANHQGVGTGHESDCAWPTHAIGDLAILVVEHGSGTVATPTGCTIVPGFPFQYSGTGWASAFYRFATSTSEANLALSGGANHMWGRIHTFRNAHQTQPFNAFSSYGRNGATTGVIYPALKTTVDDCLVVMCCFWDVDNAGPLSSAESATVLGSVTEQGDSGVVTGDGGGVVVITGTLAAAGQASSSFGGVGSSTITSSSHAVVSIALAPIADKVASSTVTIDGAAAANGETVRLLDLTQPAASYLCVDGTTGGGTGTFTCYAPYTDHNYQAVYEDGASYGASAIDVAV